jgi:hypothetical protein
MTTLAVETEGFNRYHRLVYVSLAPDEETDSPTNVRGTPPNVIPVTVFPEKAESTKLAETIKTVLFPSATVKDCVNELTLVPDVFCGLPTCDIAIYYFIPYINVIEYSPARTNVGK